MIPDAIEVRLKPKERAVLESRLRAATTEQRQLLRIRIVLAAADGSGTREIARELDTTPTTPSACGGGALPAKGSTGWRICHAPARRRSTAKPPTSAYGRCSIGHHPKALPVGTDR